MIDIKRPIVVIFIGYIIGIIWGLYTNKSIVLFYAFIYLMLNIWKIFKKKESRREFNIYSFKRYFRYIKIAISKQMILLLICISIISNMYYLYLENRHNNMYIEGKEVVERLCC